MSLGMNPDILNPQERCASTSNRNFEGRQGPGGRTHLVSTAMAAAVAGHFVDVRGLWPYANPGLQLVTPTLGSRWIAHCERDSRWLKTSDGRYRLSTAMAPVASRASAHSPPGQVGFVQSFADLLYGPVSP